MGLFLHRTLWFLRAGEFTVTPTISSRDCLQVSDVSVDKLPFPSFVRLFIKVAKSDPFRTSCVIVVGRNDSLLCPVEALLRYLHLRGSNPGPLFVFENGSALTRVKLSSVISNLLKVCNIEGDYTGHSFRIGAATTAARVGIPDNMIKTSGRWSSEAYRLYIRSSENDIARVSKKLL